MLVRVLEPVDDKGVAVLINDDADRNVVNYMTYSPKLRRVRAGHWRVLFRFYSGYGLHLRGFFFLLQS